MTKIKNTKKGMAKKTLSISLAVAMLATSNVPVWAAEDLFTDGEVAVEAFTAEEVEAPVVEDTVETPVAESDPTIDSRYEVEFKDMPSELEWNKPATVGIKVYDTVEKKDVTADPAIKVRYLDESGENEIGTYALGTIANGYAQFKMDFSNIDAYKAYLGHDLRLQVINSNHASETGYEKTSTPFTLQKVTLKGFVDGTNPDNLTSDYVRYTGKTITSVPEFDPAAVTYTYANGTNTDRTSNDLGIAEFSKNANITGADLVNSYYVSKADLNGNVAFSSILYRGTVDVKFHIERKLINNQKEFAENVGVNLPKTTFEFTGARIGIPTSKLSATNKLADKTEKAVVGDVNLTKDGVVTTKGEYTPGAWINMKEGTLKNFAMVGDFKNNAAINNNDTYYHMDSIGKITVMPRDLSNVNVVIKDVALTYLPDNKVNANALLQNNVTIYDADGTKLNSLKPFVHVNLGTVGNADLPVNYKGSYTVSIEPTDTVNVVNKASGTFKVVNQDLSTATFDKEADFSGKSYEYIGEQMTLGITKDNFKEKLGSLHYKKNVTDSPLKLTEGVDYSTEVKYGENTNVGYGTIIFEGMGSFEGSRKVITFNIIPRKMDKDALKVAKKVIYNSMNEEAADYGIVPEVTAAFKVKELGDKEVTLTVPAADYDVKQTFVSTNAVDELIRTSVEIKKDVKSNFVFVEKKDNKVIENVALSADTQITTKAITDADIIMNKTSYTYTGAEVELDYKVVVDGQELTKGVDYKAVITNGTNVGDGILTITGMGGKDGYDSTASATAKFVITPANASDLKVEPKNTIVYTGKKHNPTIAELKITLNGNDVSGQFKPSYPVSKDANINAGEGKMTLTPLKDNKNFVGTKDVTFAIKPAELKDGALTAYDAKESKVVWNANSFAFTYDGNAKEYAKTLYKAVNQGEDRVVTDNDYEIRYVDNVYGLGQNEAGTAYALVIATGNYEGTTYDLDGVVKDGVYTCENGTKITNVVKAEPFKINRLVFHKENITVSNGSYNSGFDVEPVVTVNYNGKQLIKDKDFELVYTEGENRKNVTNGKTLHVSVIGKGGYRRGEVCDFIWGIDKFDLKDATIIVSGTDAEPEVKVMNRNVLIDAKNYTVESKDGKVTITAIEGNDNYTGTQTVDIKAALEKPVAPMITDVKVVGNKATVILSGESEGATGYDYVISPNRNCIVDKDYTKVNKNKLTTDTTFTYTQQGTYYAYCHAWTRDENGKKVFSDWSNGFPFMVTAITPDQPVITNVSVKGSTVTVTYTKAVGATGYDVVLGSAMATVANEKRPVNYGTLVKKNIKANTVTATFTNVPEGTYYAGLHAFNRTSEDGKKVFSPWSNAKKVTVR